MRAGFDDLSLDELRARRSQKWRMYPDDVLPAWVAEMDFALAPPVAAALHEAIDLGDCGYAHPGALPEAFARFAAARFNWSVEPEHVTVAPDVVMGIVEVLKAVTEPGAGVVISPPVYPPFFSTIERFERKVVEAPLAEGPNGWELDLDALERAFASGARAYLLCNPHNPIGQVFTRDKLEAIAALAERYDIVVVSDEIHAPMTMPGATHIPVPSLGADAAARSVVITSTSKAWNTAGLKCAVIVAGSAQMQGRLESMPTHLVVESGHLGVLAAVAAFDSGVEWLDELVDYLDGNRRLLGELLESQLPGVGYVPPQAGFLTWLDCRSLGLGDDPAEVFLERGRVALTSGLGFGAEGAGWARLNIGTSRELLTEAVSRMAAALA
ncbi:MAG TPA: PatB family C-S lyase [Gaiellaceae bacterium]|nr:PatB family C-S lyase [Gaiellaceae bacterium]